MLISVYADSLGMPRTTEGIGYFDTYAEVARRQLSCSSKVDVAVFNRSQPGKGIDELYGQYISDESYLGPNDRDVLLIQCGVVDCAPRPLPRFLRQSVARLPSAARKLVVKFLHSQRSKLLSSGISWRLTPPSQFSGILERWLDHASQRFRLVVVIEIAPVTASINMHSPGFSNSVNEFNKLIVDAALNSLDNVICLRIADPLECRDRRKQIYITTSDGHHLTWKGHRLYGRLLARTIRKFLFDRSTTNRNVE